MESSSPTSLSEIGLNQDQVLDSIRQRISQKRVSMEKWRERYSKSEYPQRMASNLMGSNILAAMLSSSHSDYFDGRIDGGIGEAMSKVSSKSSKWQREIAERVDKRVNGKANTLGSYSDGIHYEPLMAAVKQGADGNSEAVEKIEYNWVHNALKGDLLELWLTAGLLGMSKTKSFENLFFFIDFDSKFSSDEEVDQTFSHLSAVLLSQPELYPQMPALWG